MSAEPNSPDAVTDPDLPSPPLDRSTASLDLSTTPTELVISLDNYRIVRKIGEGGMGMVYEAEQQSPRRLVALKIIRGGPLAGQRAEKLFQREIQALARLRHPGIAAIYESGKTAAGQYFYSMELGSGKTLDAYLSEQLEPSDSRDPLRTRLELFLRIAAAINYAHQRGVIHRDLKPSNVLVSDKNMANATYTSFADNVEVKVLDFGLARITGPDTEGQTALSQVGRLEGTLAYMSPEQVRLNPDEIDLRTDIYSLGVMLYVMIAGRLPYSVQRLPLPQAAQIICEQSPQPLTTNLTRSAKVDSDLNTIVATAMAKEPSRRYQSVAALAEDIRRYLADEPIVARAPSALYQVKKLVTRHRVVAAFSLALLVVLVGSSIAMVIQARRIRREAETSRRVSQFMVDLFKGSDPEQSLGRKLTVREVLETGAKRVATELKTEPGVQSQLQYTIGSVFKSLSSYPEALAQLQASLAARKQLYGEGSLQAAEVYDELGDTLRIMGKFAESRTAAERAVAIRRSRLGNSSELTAEALNRLALTLQDSNNFDESDKYYREALAILEKVKGPDSIETSTLLNDYSILKRRQGDLAAAENLRRRALDIRRKAFPDGHPLLANSLQALGSVLAARGDYVHAEQLSREALAMREKLFGVGSPGAMKSVGELASVLADLGKNDEAAILCEQKLAADRKLMGEESPIVAIDLNNLASARGQLKQFDEAETLYRRSLSIRTRLFGENSPQTATVLNNLAGTLQKKGDFAQAETLYQKSLEIRIRAQGERHPDVAFARFNLGSLYSARGSLREAEGLLRTGVDDLLKAEPGRLRTAQALATRADFYVKTDRPNEADRDYGKAIEIYKASLPPSHPFVVSTRQKYEQFLASHKR